MMESDEELRKLLQENAMEKAPEDLFLRVLNTLESDSTPLAEHKPLISKKGWTGIVLGILSLCAMVLLPASFFEQLTHNPVTGTQWFHFFNWEGIHFPEFSKTTRIGIMTFAVFGLLHILWMKQHLSRIYK